MKKLNSFTKKITFYLIKLSDLSKYVKKSFHAPGNKRLEESRRFYTRTDEVCFLKFQQFLFPSV